VRWRVGSPRDNLAWGAPDIALDLFRSSAVRPQRENRRIEGDPNSYSMKAEAPVALPPKVADFDRD